MISGTYFRIYSNISIVVNLLVGIGAIFLVERLVPAMEDAMNKTTFLVTNTFEMQQSVLISNQERFWKAYELIKENSKDRNSGIILKVIKDLGTQFFAEGNEHRLPLNRTILELSQIHVEAMSHQSVKARILGIAGGWALGFLVLLSLILQLVLRYRVIATLFEPISRLVLVLKDYWAGNPMRRFTVHRASKDVAEAGIILNKILDTHMNRS